MYQAFLTGLEWLLPKLLGLWSVISQLLNGTVNLLLANAKFIMQVFTGDFAGAWETMKAGITGEAGAIWDAIVALLDWIAGLFGSNLQEIGATWAGIWESMKTTVSLVWGIVVGYFQGIWNDIVGIWSGIGTFFQGVWNGFLNVVTTVGLVIMGAVFTFLDWVLGFFGTSITELSAKWTAGWNNILTILSAAWDRISTFWSGAWAAFSAFWSGAWNSIVAFVTTTGGKLVATGSTIITNLWTSLKAAWAYIVSWWTEVWNKAVATIVTFYTPIFNAGKSIVQGLWDGLKSIWSQISTWWNNTIGSLIDKARSILDSHSPSGEFFKIGQSITDGLVGGLGKNIQVPVNMIGNLGSSMISAMGGMSNNTTSNTITINISGSDPRAIFDELMRQLKLQGISIASV